MYCCTHTSIPRPQGKCMCRSCVFFFRHNQSQKAAAFTPSRSTTVQTFLSSWTRAAGCDVCRYDRLPPRAALLPPSEGPGVLKEKNGRPRLKIYFKEQEQTNEQKEAKQSGLEVAPTRNSIPARESVRVSLKNKMTSR